MKIEHIRERAPRFMELVQIGPNGCWQWTARLDLWGYGVFKIKHRPTLAHRVSKMIQMNRVLARDEIVCHECDNPGCVNPAHLFVGTLADNSRDMIAKGRGSFQKLAPADVEAIRAIHGVPQEQIARQYGVSANTISRVKCGRTHRGRHG